MQGEHGLVSGVIVYVLKRTEQGTRALFLRRSGGLHEGGWWPVAGTPESAESPLQTARRELEEETGLTPDSWQDFGIDIPNADGVRILKAYVVFVAEGDRVRLNYEHDDMRWLSGEEVLNIVPASSSEYLEHLIEHFMRE